jgi:hypothetical protein
VKPIVIYLFAVLASAGVVLALAARILPATAGVGGTNVLTTVMVESARVPLSMNGQTLKHEPDRWMVALPNDSVVSFSRENILKGIADGVWFSYLVPVLTLICWRHWDMGWLPGMLLAAVCFAVAYFGIPAADGFIRGGVVALFGSQIQAILEVFRIVPSIPPVLISGVIVSLWLATRWALASDEPMTPRPDFRVGQRACLLAAGAASATVAGIWSLVILHNLFAGVSSLEPPAVPSWRAVVICLAYVLASILLLMAIRQAKPVRSAWIVMLLVLPLGAESAGALALLLAAMCDAPRTPRAATVQAAAMAEA